MSWNPRPGRYCRTCGVFGPARELIVGRCGSCFLLLLGEVFTTVCFIAVVVAIVKWGLS